MWTAHEEEFQCTTRLYAPKSSVEHFRAELVVNIPHRQGSVNKSGPPNIRDPRIRLTARQNSHNYSKDRLIIHGTSVLSS